MKYGVTVWAFWCIYCVCFNVIKYPVYNFYIPIIMMFIDTIIFLLWGLFSLAAIAGLLQEFQSNRETESPVSALEDDDPVFLV